MPITVFRCHRCHFIKYANQGVDHGDWFYQLALGSFTNVITTTCPTCKEMESLRESQTQDQTPPAINSLKTPEETHKASP
jgi:hypothetical protein